MSGLISGLVFRHFPGGKSELLLAVKLADNADDKGRRIFPSIATLAADTRQSERTVQRQLRHMVALGWLQLVRQARGGGRGGDCGRPREYRIHPDWVQQFDATLPEASRPVWTPRPAPAPKSAKEMGDKLTPISSPASQDKSVDKQYPTKEMGDIAVSEMGDIAVSPEPSLTSVNTDPPHPPAGGVRVFAKTETPTHPQSAAQADQLGAVAQLLAVWPPSRRQRAADVAQAMADIAAAGGPSPAQLAAAARATADAQGDRWQADGGRWAPTPLRWLREQRWLDAEHLAEPAPPAVPALPQAAAQQARPKRPPPEHVADALRQLTQRMRSGAARAAPHEVAT